MRGPLPPRGASGLVNPKEITMGILKKRIAEVWEGQPPIIKHETLCLPSVETRSMTIVREYLTNFYLESGALRLWLPYEGLEVVSTGAGGGLKITVGEVEHFVSY